MNIYINQSILIQQLKVGSVSSASVFQIGTSGTVNASSSFNNSGQYGEAIEPLQAPGQIITRPPR
ncbi:MAG: spore germination protein GerPB [Bacilli bacterium]